MDQDESGETLRNRIARQGEDALGKLAQDLLENSIVTSAISRAFEARERAVSAQETAMSALNLPSAADLERLTRRLRSVSQRIEGLEDGVDRLDQRFAELRGDGANPLSAVEERLGAIEAQMRKLASDVALLARASDAAPAPVPREQERLAVENADDGKPAPKPRKPRTKKSASS